MAGGRRQDAKAEAPVSRTSTRGSRRTSAPGPVLKWAGGKSQLLAQYDRWFPRRFAAYFEPFVGGAAVFFHLLPSTVRHRVRLADLNEDLIEVYRTLQTDLEALIQHLAEHAEKHSEEHFYRVRSWTTEELAPVERAARLIYLNKTCYNGLYRVNSSGQFNVPFGRYKNPSILVEPRLRAAARALEGVELAVEGFESVLEHAREGDLVYFDPPYHPLSATSRFTSYTRWDFGEAEQVRLSEVFRELASRRVQVLLSNSNSPLIHQLYQGFPIHLVRANRFINSKGDSRHAIHEVLVCSFR